MALGWGDFGLYLLHEFSLSPNPLPHKVLYVFTHNTKHRDVCTDMHPYLTHFSKDVSKTDLFSPGGTTLPVG